MLHTENETALTCYIFESDQPLLNSYGVLAIYCKSIELRVHFVINCLICCKITNADMTFFLRHWFFLNMPFTKEDKILIKISFELKGYNSS